MADRINTLEMLFFEELKDLYDAEHQLIEALPKMAQAAKSGDLKTGFQQHLDQTRKQATRLEQIFQEHGEKVTRKECVGMRGIIREGEKFVKEDNIPADVRDAALIASAQKAEHYEMATYGTLRTYANQLGFDKTAQMLQTTLNEESDTNEKLTLMAISHINQEAKR